MTKTELANIIDDLSKDYPSWRSTMADGLGGGGRETWANNARAYLDRRVREDNVTRADIFDAYTSDVLRKSPNDYQLRIKLMLVLGLCTEWISVIDVRNKMTDV